jgi:hypothetical protein
MNRMSSRRSWRVGVLALVCLTVAGARPWTLWAQSPAPSAGVKFATIAEADAKQWLTYLASDALQGRQIYTEGYGLAASYIAENLRAWGVKPLGDMIGDQKSYFQSVKNKGYRVTRNSSITVEVGGQSRTFKHGDHVTFPANAGGKQTINFSGVEFVGYGIVSSTYKVDDFAGRDLKGKLVLSLSGTPAAVVAQMTQAGGGGRGGGRGLNATAAYMQLTLGAGGVLNFQPAPPPPTAADETVVQAEAALVKAQEALDAARAQAFAQGGRGGRGGGGRGGGGGGGRGAQPATPADLTSVQNVNNLLPPTITGDETFYDFLFTGASAKFSDLRAKATAGEPLAPMTLNARVRVDIDNSYDVVSTQFSKNVVGMVEGTDPALKSTYVMFGAHLDHVGYRTAAGGGGRAGGRGAAPAAGENAEPDLISNGADDDGSGSTGLLGIAKAFATGPKPKRSVVFVWHAGEEAGLLGSKYNADFPVVPLDKVQAQLNIDMIGRNRNDDPSQSNNVYVIGADRISTDLHNLVVDTDASLTKPVHLDYEYNDPSDTNSFYTRSDHYSYAAKGIPIAFFFTGIHVDYHQVGDQVEKIMFPKLVSIAQLVYQTGFNIANTDRVLVRDNLGPRSGKGFEGKIRK